MHGFLRLFRGMLETCIPLRKADVRRCVASSDASDDDARPCKLEVTYFTTRYAKPRTARSGAFSFCGGRNAGKRLADVHHPPAGRRVRARRGILAVRRRRTAPSRFRAGLGRELPGPCTRSDRRGAGRAGRARDQREPGLPQRAHAGPGRALGRTVGAGEGVLRQQRRRSQRGRDQAGAQVGRAAQGRGVRDPHLRARLPWPHPGHHVGFGKAAVGGAVCAQGTGFPQAADQRPGRRARRHRVEHRGGDARAHPGRVRGGALRRRIPARPARAVRPGRAAADLRRDPDRRRPHRAHVLLGARRRAAGHHDAGQGPGRRRAAGRAAGEGDLLRASSPATRAAPSTATR